ELATELRTLEMELLVRRYFQFRNSSEKSETHYQELSARVATLRTELQAIEEEQLAYRSKADEVQQTLEDNQALNFELNRDLQETRSQVALLTQRRENNSERRGSIERQIAEYLENARLLEEGTTQSQSELDQQEAELAELRAEHEKRQAAYEALKGDSDASAEKMARMRTEITAAVRARMEKENEIRVARVMEDKLSDELGQSDAEMQAL